MAQCHELQLSFDNEGRREVVAEFSAGYEDLNDHEQLRNDPLLGLLAGEVRPDK